VDELGTALLNQMIKHETNREIAPQSRQQDTGTKNYMSNPIAALSLKAQKRQLLWLMLPQVVRQMLPGLSLCLMLSQVVRQMLRQQRTHSLRVVLPQGETS
jgi:hypothetical protein